jgi:hypothetical protein
LQIKVLQIKVLQIKVLQIKVLQIKVLQMMARALRLPIRLSLLFVDNCLPTSAGTGQIL